MIDKTRKSMKWLQVSSIIFLFLNPYNTQAQTDSLNKYGLFVVNSAKVLQSEIASDSNKEMMDVKKAVPGVILDLRYATSNNFMHKKLYPEIHTTYLRRPAANALRNALNEFRKQHLTIKIFDAYRPYSVTEALWEPVKDDRYAADPAKGSGHNRGIAMDITLVDLRTGKELPMGTGFDNFSDTAHSDFKNLSENILQNRLLLINTIAKYGLVVLDTEWWHFYLPDANRYELLNVSFDDLKKMAE